MNTEQQSIKQSLSNFVGALVETSDRSNEEARHEAVAALLEEVLHLSNDNGEQKNIYVLKPLFRAVTNILIERKKELIKLQVSQEALDRIEQTIEYLKKIAE